MNKNQIGVIVLAILGIAAIVIFTPRYKLTWIDSKNFIKTEQTSTLYKRSAGKEYLHWDRIGALSGVTAVTALVLVAALRTRRG